MRESERAGEGEGSETARERRKRGERGCTVCVCVFQRGQGLTSNIEPQADEAMVVAKEI